MRVTVLDAFVLFLDMMWCMYGVGWFVGYVCSRSMFDDTFTSKFLFGDKQSLTLSHQIVHIFLFQFKLRCHTIVLEGDTLSFGGIAVSGLVLGPAYQTCVPRSQVPSRTRKRVRKLAGPERMWNGMDWARLKRDCGPRTRTHTEHKLSTVAHPQSLEIEGRPGRCYEQCK
jgi:hypothetical protein